MVSICIPTFNGERFLRQTIESILNQSLEDIEVIISDHGSTDRTVEIIREFELRDSRIRSHQCLDKRQVEHNWNSAIEVATGKYLKLVCQDDVILPNSVLRQVQVLESNSEIAFCFSPRDVIGPSGKVLLKSHGLKIESCVYEFQGNVRQLVRSGTNIFGEPCAVLTRRSCLINAGPFSGRYLIDLNMWMRLWEIGPAYFLKECSSQFRVSASSWTSALQGSQALEFKNMLNDFKTRHSALISKTDLKKGYRRARLLEFARAMMIRLAEVRQ
jgi:glycosyltransferase involved in cell wall biosynthesis